jgi:hypothetical protein
MMTRARAPRQVGEANLRELVALKATSLSEHGALGAEAGRV